MVFKRLNLDLYTITVQGFFIISPILSFSEKKPDLDCKSQAIMKCMQFLLFVTFEIMLRRHKYSPRRRNFVTHFPSSITNKNASLTEVKRY